MPTDPPFQLLFVCTGNICRSPAAELYARRVLAARLGAEADARFVVRSAGVYGLTGWPIEPRAAEALRAYGVVEARDFRARRIDADLVGTADLVLTATRDHRASVATLVPRAAERAFTLREIARLVRGLTPADLPPVDPATRARALVAAAAERRGLVTGRPGDDDVADPYGEGPAAYNQATRDIVAALDVVLDLIVPEEAA